MFKKILVPVDLAHLDNLSRALSAAAALAKSQNADVVYAGVYGNVPQADLPNPDDYANALERLRLSCRPRPRGSRRRRCPSSVTIRTRN